MVQDRSTAAMLTGLLAAGAIGAGAFLPWFSVNAGMAGVTTSAWGLDLRGLGMGGSSSWWESGLETLSDGDPALLWLRITMIGLAVSLLLIGTGAVYVQKCLDGSKDPELLLGVGGGMLVLSAGGSAVAQISFLSGSSASITPGLGLFLTVFALALAIVANQLAERTRKEVQEGSPPPETVSAIRCSSCQGLIEVAPSRETSCRGCGVVNPT